MRRFALTSVSALALVLAGAAVDAPRAQVAANGSGASVTLANTALTNAGAGTIAAAASGGGAITFTNVGVTVAGQDASGLRAEDAGSIVAMHGGSLQLQDDDTVSAINGIYAGAAVAANGGRIVIDQGATITIGQSGDLAPLANGVTAISLNGAASEIDLTDVVITDNAPGAAGDTTGRAVLVDGTGAIGRLTGVTITNGLVDDANGGMLVVSGTTLDGASAENRIYTAAGAPPAAGGGELVLQDDGERHTTITTSADEAFGIVGGNTDAANAGRNVTDATNVVVVTGGGVAAGNSAVYGTGQYGAVGVFADNSADIHLHGGSILTTGIGSSGIEATDGSRGVVPAGAGVITVDALGAAGATSIHTTNTNAYGAWANLGGQIDIADAAVTTEGTGAYGLYAALGDSANPDLSTTLVRPSSIAMTGGSIVTGGSGAYGVVAQGKGVGIALTGTSVTAGNAFGALADSGGALSFADVSLSGSAGGIRVTDSAGAGSLAEVTVTGGSVSGGTGDALAADGAKVSFLVRNGARIGTGGVDLLDVANGAAATFVGDGSTETGAIAVDASSTADVTFQNGNLWNVTANSTMTSLTDNAGTIAFVSPAQGRFKTVTTGSFTGTGGTIVLNTVLGTDNSASDMLVIDGGTATGSTLLRIVNAGGSGASTSGDGIKVVDAVDGAATSATAFRLASAVSAGAYEYGLFHGGVGADANDQDWYLRETGLSPSLQTALPYAVVLADYAGATLATWGQRNDGRIGRQEADFGASACRDAVRQWDRGDRCRSDPDRNGSYQRGGPEIHGQGAWARVGGQYSSEDPRSGSSFTQSLGFLQAGYEGVVAEKADGVVNFGAYATVGTSRADVRLTSDPVTGAARKGTITTSGYGLGADLTWLGDDGLYVDGVGQLILYDSTLSDKPGSDNEGHSASLSVEIGKRLRYRDGWAIVPQAQLAWTDVDFDDFTDTSNARIKLGDGASLKGRAGLRLEKETDWRGSDRQPNNVKLYGVANLSYEFLGNTSIETSGLTFEQKEAGLWGEVGVGGSYAWNEAWSAYGEGTVATSLSSGADGHAVEGTAGMRYKW